MGSHSFGQTNKLLVTYDLCYRFDVYVVIDAQQDRSLTIPPDHYVIT